MSSLRAMKAITPKAALPKIIFFLACIQAVVFYAHWVVYETLIFAFMPNPQTLGYLRAVLFGLSISFVVLQIGINNWKSRVFDALYKVSAVWLGTLHFLTLACAVFWLVAEVTVPFGVIPPFSAAGSILLSLALLVSAYGAIRSFRPGYTRYYVTIPGLPAAWRGRKAVLVSDVHLGSIRGERSAKKMVQMINAEKPDIVFLPGDLFDGPPADYDRLAAPLAGIQAPHGTFFTEGNHEEFQDPAPYLSAVRAAGVKILDKEMEVIDGVQIVGIPFHGSNEPEEVRASLAATSFDPEKPSILLKHAPSVARAVSMTGVSLMLSGHTHKGQVWPYSFFVHRLFGRAAYGHSEYGTMQVITTSGYGTWGPPQRIGTRAEVVVIKFS